MLYHKDKGKLQETLGSSMLIAYFLGFIEIVICGLLIISGYLPTFLGITSEVAAHYQASLGLIVLMIMWLLIGSFGGILARLLIPVGMLYESQWWGILVRFGQFISLIGVAVLGGNILTACIVFSIVQASISFLSFIYIKRKLPEFYPWWEKRSWHTALNNFRKSLVLTFSAISQQLSNSGLIIFVATLFSVALVPAFTTVRTLTNTAGAVTNIFISSLLPDIVRFHSKGEAEKLITTFKANWFFSGFIVNFGLVIVLPVIEPLYIFWTKGKLEFNFLLFFFLAASISFANFGSGLNLYLAGINNLISQTTITVSRVFIIFVVSLISVKYLGLAGIGLAILISEVVCSALLLYFVNIQLRKIECRLDDRAAFLALLPPVLISSLSISYFFLDSVNMFSGLIFISLLVIYKFKWNDLEQEVKIRLKCLIGNLK